MTTQTQTVAEFLLARYDEAESGARVSCSEVHPGADVYHYEGHPDPRVLADLAAKRRIVGQHSYQAHVCPDDRWERRGSGFETFAATEDECPTLRYLASIYSDHPDYRAEWRA